MHKELGTSVQPLAIGQKETKAHSIYQKIVLCCSEYKILSQLNFSIELGS